MKDEKDGVSLNAISHPKGPPLRIGRDEAWPTKGSVDVLIWEDGKIRPMTKWERFLHKIRFFK